VAEIDPLICLGIESTADNLGVGVASSDGKILANEVKVHVPTSAASTPAKQARHHSENIGNVLSRALEKAQITAKDIDMTIFRSRPGSRPLPTNRGNFRPRPRSYLEIPLVGVNHCISHIEVGRLATGAKDPLTLYVSGGNTIVSGFESGRYRCLRGDLRHSNR